MDCFACLYQSKYLLGGFNNLLSLFPGTAQERGRRVPRPHGSRPVLSPSGDPPFSPALTPAGGSRDEARRPGGAGGAGQGVSQGPGCSAPRGRGVQAPCPPRQGRRSGAHRSEAAGVPVLSPPCTDSHLSQSSPGPLPPRRTTSIFPFDAFHFQMALSGIHFLLFKWWICGADLSADSKERWAAASHCSPRKTADLWLLTSSKHRLPFGHTPQ